MSRSETVPRRRAGELGRRYTAGDLEVLTEEETSRFVRSGRADPGADIDLAWQLLYRCEPELYDRLVAAERLHPQILTWLPHRVERIVEIGAGTGRLTVELVHRARELIAIEPAAPLRQILSRKLSAIGHGDRARVADGFFDGLPVPDACSDLVVACSALTPSPEHGGESGLMEMERVCKTGGQVVVVWPNNLDWLTGHGYRHVSFAGEMAMEFATPREAAQLIDIFYPRASAVVRRSGGRRVPYSVVGVNPPCDLAFKVMRR